MLLLVLRLFVSLTQANHEEAHRLCEVGVYITLAPDAGDDEAIPWVEGVAEVACRNDPADRWRGISRFSRF